MRTSLLFFKNFTSTPDKVKEICYTGFLFMPQPKEKEFVILDTETTGLNPNLGDCLVELAGQRIRGEEVIGHFSHIINAGVPCKPDAAAIHGISDETIKKEGKTLQEVMPKFVEFCQGATLVGHNVIKFDMEFINNHLRQLGLQPMDNEVIDTLHLARRTLDLPDYRLKTLAAHYDINYDNAHRAMRDVEITREVFYKLIGLKKNATARLI